MPTIRRFGPARREHVELSNEMDFAFQFGPWLDIDEAMIQDAWATFGPEFLKQHAVERPGTRPWAWWANESPEPRRVNALHHGACGASEKERRRGGFCLVSDGRGGTTQLLESEDAYIERHALWLPGERERFATKS